MPKVPKVPVIMQMEALECGAASLAMILAFHGKWIPLEQVREDCGVSRDGSNSKSMMKAARNYGLKATGYKCEVESLKGPDIKMPCIIHWNFNHFVVLNGFKGDTAILNDPARGTVQVTKEEFDQSFTGVVLAFEKGENFQPSGKPKSIMGFVKSRLEGTLVPFIFVIITGLLVTLVGILQPGFGRVFNDKLITRKNPEWLPGFLIGVALLTVFNILVSVIKLMYMLKIKAKFAIVSNSQFLWHVLRLPMRFFSQRMVGDIVTRQGSNEGITEALIGQFAPVLLNVGMLFFYLFFLLKQSLFLTTIGLFSVAVNLVSSIYMNNKMINFSRAQMRDSGKAASVTMSGIEMIETIKSSGAENGYFERWSGYQASLSANNIKLMKTQLYSGQVAPMIVTALNTVIQMIGVYYIMQYGWTWGRLEQFLGYIGAFLGPISMLIGLLNNVQQMRVSMERIQDVMEYKPDVEYDKAEDDNKPAVIDYTKLKGNIEMKNVTFGYNKLAPPLIENFNMTLKPGSRVAFVGFSGCGKSTLAKLISGLYKPWSGEINFDGKPMEKIDRQVFTASLSVVDQDIIMFEDSIANNIKMWDTSIEDFEMILGARDAQIHSDVMVREGGYNHRVLEGGKNFSGGQRQRFEIARVLAADPTIIVLDEATSALDAKTEYEVTKAIKERGITCVIVAHRLSTIRDCDEIIVMDKGKVMERGTHEQLYNSGGLYSQLISTD